MHFDKRTTDPLTGLQNRYPPRVIWLEKQDTRFLESLSDCCYPVILCRHRCIFASPHLNAMCLGRPSACSTGCIRKGLGPSGGGFNCFGSRSSQLGWRSSLASTPPGNTNAFGMNLLRLLLLKVEVTYNSHSWPTFNIKTL